MKMKNFRFEDAQHYCLSWLFLQRQTKYILHFFILVLVSSCGSRSELPEPSLKEREQGPSIPDKLLCLPSVRTIYRPENVSFIHAPQDPISLYPQEALSSENPWDVLTTNLNQDNFTDLVVVGKGSNQMFFLSGDGLGGFDLLDTKNVFNLPSSVSMMDVDQDGKDDLIISFDSSPLLEIYSAKNNFQSSIYLKAFGDRISDVAMADFNQDGQVDFVTVDSSENLVNLSIKGTNQLDLVRSIDVDVFPLAVIASDLNGDKIQDIALVGNTESLLGYLVVIFGGPEGFSEKFQKYPTSGYANTLAFADLDGDGLEDLVVGNSFEKGGDGFSENVDVFFNDSTGIFKPKQMLKAGKSPGAVAIVDLNKDGIFDIVAGNSLSFDLSIFMGIGKGNFLSAKYVEAKGQPKAITFGDFNEDCLIDIAVANYYNGTISILLNNSDVQ